MACVTIDSLTRKLMLVGCVENQANIFRALPGNIAKRSSKLLVYYCDEHTCPFTAYSERATDDVGRKVAENPDAIYLLKFKLSKQCHPNKATAMSRLV